MNTWNVYLCEYGTEGGLWLHTPPIDFWAPSLRFFPTHLRLSLHAFYLIDTDNFLNRWLIDFTFPSHGRVEDMQNCFSVSPVSHLIRSFFPAAGQQFIFCASFCHHHTDLVWSWRGSMCSHLHFDLPTIIRNAMLFWYVNVCTIQALCVCLVILHSQSTVLFIA